jgi:hypothetical protein
VIVLRIVPVANSTADVNGDRHLDLLVPNNASNTVSVLPGVGYGGFTPAAPVPVDRPVGLAVGDLNGGRTPRFHRQQSRRQQRLGTAVSMPSNNGSGGFVADASAQSLKKASNANTIQI